MTTWSESLYWRTRAVLVPDLENSHYAYALRLRSALDGAERWLDVGCGHSVFPDWLSRRLSPLDLRGRLAVGVDADRSAIQRHPLFKLRVEGNGETLPFRDESFELVTANMVLEHVSDPSSLFTEVARVLKPGGRFIAHTPNAFGYTTALTRAIPSRLRTTIARLLQGRAAEDVYPTHYRANATPALRRLAAASGLDVERIEFVQTSPQLIAIAPLMVGEMLVIRALSTDLLSRFRACLIADFRKPG